MVNERVNVYWEYKITKMFNDLITMITEDDCTFNEFIIYANWYDCWRIYIYEISDEISQIKPSHKFVEVYKSLVLKYPKKQGIIKLWVL